MKIKTREPAGRTPMSWVYQNVQLTGINLYYPNVLFSTNNELVFPICEKTMSLNASSTYGEEFTPPDVLVTQEVSEPVLFFIYNTDNYFHFLYDALPILQPSMKLLMNPKHNYPFIEDCLQLCGISSDQILYANGHTNYKEVHVFSSPTHEGLPNEPPHPSIWKVYELMKARAYKILIQTPLKIYVSRRSWIHGDTTNIGTNYTTRRKMMVEDELVKELTKKGYTEVFCELLTMTEKIQYFGNATHIVGAIGGGMCNIIFSNPTCKVYSIHSPEFDTINYRFLFTMNHTQVLPYRNTFTKSNLYRRVKLPEGFGEIEKETEEGFLVSVNKDGVTFQNEEVYPTILVPKETIHFMDNGLNSPWYFNVTEFMETIQ
jgi:hypothetical protein